MGTSSVAMDAALHVLNRSKLEQGNVTAQWWAAELLEALGGASSWFRCGGQPGWGALQRTAMHIMHCTTAARSGDGVG